MSFDSLPPELQIRIITESVEDPLPSPVSSSTSAIVHLLDAPLAAALALCSPDCNAIVMPLLYSQVRITTPSSLRQFSATLRKHPDLAKLVIKLHIGPQRRLPVKGWPIGSCLSDGFSSEHDVLIGTTLAQHRLPRWCKPDTTFRIINPPDQCYMTPMEEVIQSAMKDIDVNPWESGYALSGRSRGHTVSGRTRGSKIGIRAWSMRLFLLQAALDIYLINMREVEEARADKPDEASSLSASSSSQPHQHQSHQSCPSAGHGPYPKLSIRFRDDGLEAPSEDSLLVSGTQLWAHLLRPGGSADHFDHLVRLTRSRPGNMARDEATGPIDTRRSAEWRRVGDDLGRARLVDELSSRWFSAEGRIEAGQAQDCDDESDSDEEGLYGTKTDYTSDIERGEVRNRGALEGERVEELLDLCRSTLARTPHVTSLSLSSYLHLALPHVCAPKAVRSIVLGPRARYWKAVLPNEETLWRFEGLTRLRVAGKMHPLDADKIAEALPSLEEVECELPNQRGGDYRNAWSLITALQGSHFPSERRRQLRPPGQSSSVGGQRDSGIGGQSAASALFWSEGTAASSELPRAEPPHSHRRTLALLTPFLARAVLALPLASDEQRMALEQGGVAPGCLHPVKLAISDVIVVAKRRIAPIEMVDSAALYAKSLRWWLEG